MKKKRKEKNLCTHKCCPCLCEFKRRIQLPELHSVGSHHGESCGENRPLWAAAGVGYHTTKQGEVTKLKGQSDTLRRIWVYLLSYCKITKMSEDGA